MPSFPLNTRAGLICRLISGLMRRASVPECGDTPISILTNSTFPCILTLSIEVLTYLQTILKTWAIS